MTRKEHIAWAKERALEYLPDNPIQAFASMVSDLNKHDETQSIMTEPGAFAPFSNIGIDEHALSEPVVRRWIEGIL